MTDLHDVKVFAISLHLYGIEAFTGPAMKEYITSLNDDIAARCSREGMTFLGHVKGLIRDQGGRFLKFNSTRPDDPPDVDGHWSSGSIEGTFDLNVLVFGLTEGVLEDACMASIDIVSARFGIVVEKEHCHHHHEQHNIITIHE